MPQEKFPMPYLGMKKMLRDMSYLCGRLSLSMAYLKLYIMMGMAYLSVLRESWRQ